MFKFFNRKLRIVIALVILVLCSGVVLAGSGNPLADLTSSINSLCSSPGFECDSAVDKKEITKLSGKLPSSAASVLAGSTAKPKFVFTVNVESFFRENARFARDVDIEGTLRAPNLFRGVVAGTGIQIAGDDRNPTINNTGVLSVQGVSGDISFTGTGIAVNGTNLTNTGVLSLQGQTGAVNLTNGTGIVISGTTITNTGVTDFQGSTGSISLNEGTGIDINGLTITNTDPGSSQSIFKTITTGSTSFSAGSNSDTLTFAEGTGITITPDSLNKSLTISANVSSSEWQRNSGAVSPLNTSDDLLIGGSSTASALFRVNGTNGAVTIGSDTISDISGDGLVVSGNNLGINLLSSSDSAGLTISRSGLELRPGTGSVNQLTLLQGCNDDQILKWDEVNGVWRCAADAGGAGAGIIDIQEGTSPAISVDTIRFDQNQFDVSQLASTGVVSLDAELGLWKFTNGTYYPQYSTADLLIGGTTTSSAKFAVLNVASNTPIASVSGGMGSNGIFMTANGVLSTTNRQSLTIGNSSLYNSTGNILINPNGIGLVGIGSANPNATVDISSTHGTLPIASLSGRTSSAGLLVDNSGSGDIFTASSSGKTRFVIKQNGNIGVNMENPLYPLHITGYTDFRGRGPLYISASDNSAVGAALTLDSSNLASSKAWAIISTGNSATAGPGKFGIYDSTSDIYRLLIDQNGNVGIGSNVYNNSSTLDVRATTGTFSIASFSGQTTNAGLIVDNSGSGDILSASSSGLSRFTIRQNGEIVASNYTVNNGLLFTDSTGLIRQMGSSTGSSTDCLLGDLTWGTCTGSGATNWDVNTSLGTISPKYAGTLDLLLGGTTTSSAKFSVLGLAGGTPTASVSGQTGNGIVIASNGSLQSLRNNTLLLGGDTTGDISIDGNTGITGTLSVSGLLSASNFSGSSSGTNTGDQNLFSTIAVSGQTNVVANALSDTLNFAAGSGITITTNGTDTVTIAQTGGGTSKWVQNDSSGTLTPNISTLDLLLGGTTTSSARFAALNMAGGVATASVSGGFGGTGLFVTADGSVQTTNRQSLTLGGGQSGNIVLSGNTSVNGSFGVSGLSTGVVTNTNGVLSSEAQLALSRGGTGASLADPNADRILFWDDDAGAGSSGWLSVANGLEISGTTLQHTDTSTVSDSNNSNGVVIQDITFDTYGHVSTVGTIDLDSRYMLIGGAGGSKWDQNNALGTLTPNISTLDLLLGGTTTSSARFAALNMAGGVATASVSGGFGGTGLFVTADGSVQTTNRQSLTLGGGQTGEIVLSGNAIFNGSITINSETFTDLTGDGLAVSGNALNVDLLSSSDSAGLTNSRSGLEFRVGTGSKNQLTLIQGCANNQVLKWDEVNGVWGCANDNGGGGGTTISVQEGSDSPISGIDTIRFDKNQFDVSNISATGVVALDSSIGIWRHGAGVIYQGLATEDFLLGGSSTASAKFAVTGLSTDNPSASISATTGSNAGKGVVLSSSGSVQSLNNSTLTLGGNTTGNILLSPLNGIAGSYVTPSTNQQVDLGISSLQFRNIYGQTLYQNGNTVCDSSGNCAGGAGGSKWTQNDSAGTLTPNISTLDLLIGGTATASALARINGTTGAITAGTYNGVTIATTSGTLNLAGGSLILSGADSLTLTTSGATNVTLPTTGTLSTLAGTEAFTNKTLTNSNNTIGGVTMTLGSDAEGDIYYRGATGVLTRLARGGAGDILTVSGNTPVWSAPGGTLNFWQRNLGAVSPLEISNDFLLGSTSTTSARFAVLNIAGGTATASVSGGFGGNGAFLTADGTLSTTRRQTLTIGNSTAYNTTGNILINPNGVGLVGIGTSNPLATLDIRGTSGTLPAASVSARSSYASMVVDQLGAGDIFSASASGLNRFSIQRSGKVLLSTTEYNNCTALETVGGLLTCGTDDVGGGGTNYWDLAANSSTLNPKTPFADLLIGGVTSASARFAVLNMAGGTTTTPVASVSGGVNGRGSYLTADGTLGTTRRQTLTIGNSTAYNTTGNVLINPNGVGYLGIGTTAPTYIVDVRSSAAENTTVSLTNSNASGRAQFSVVNNANNYLNFGIKGGSDSTYGVMDANEAFFYTISDFNIVGDGKNVIFATLTGANESMRITNTGRVGVGTINPSATLDVRGNSASTPVASFSATSNFAGVVVDNSGAGDIFTASSSGITRFVIKQNGNIGIGTNLPGAALDVNGNILTGANSTFDTRSAGTLGIGTATQTGLTLGRTGATSTLNGDASSVINFGNFGVASTGNITVAAGQGLDTNAAGILAIGNTTATTVNIGNTAATTIALGAGGALARAINIGTGTGVDTISIGTGGTGADVINIGSANAGAVTVRSNAVLTLAGSTNSIIDFPSFDVSATGNITAPTDETINGIDINAGAVSDIDSILGNATSRFAFGGGALSNYNVIADSGFAGVDLAATDDDLFIEDVLEVNGTARFDGTVALPGLAGNNRVLFADNTTGNVTAVAATSTSGLCLLSGATTTDPSWQTCPAGGSSNWDVQNGTITPKLASTLSLLIGGTTSSSASFQVFGKNALNSGTIPTASISGRTSSAALIIDNNNSNRGGDILTASSSGLTRFTIKNTGKVIIGNETNGIVFDPTSTAENSSVLYAGNARPTRQIVLSPEYPGAILTANGSTAINGSLTSDASPSAQLYRNYYEWSSDETSLQDYTVAIRVTLPKDFSAWTTSNAMQIEYNTELGASGSNKLDVTVLNASEGSVASSTNQFTTSKTWTYVTIDDSTLDNGGADLDAAGEVAIIQLKMYSRGGSHVQIGDIILNYLTKF